MIGEAVCVLGFSLLIAGENPAMEKDTRYWIAANLCAAANDSGIDPRILGAYVLNENRKFDLWAVRPAVKGTDHGLFQENSYYQHDRRQIEYAHHPYYGAVIAANIIADNLKSYGWSWKAFAAYWSQGQAQRSTAAAKAYYRRFVNPFPHRGSAVQTSRASLERRPHPCGERGSAGNAGRPPLLSFTTG